MMQNQTPLLHFAEYLYCYTVFYKFEERFFYQLANDARSVFTLVKKRPSDFLKEGLALKTLKGGLLFVLLAS